MAFTFRLEKEDGAPADPPSFRTSVLTWRRGDTIPLGYESLATGAAGTLGSGKGRWRYKRMAFGSLPALGVAAP
jgi:hypothetical protein